MALNNFPTLVTGTNKKSQQQLQQDALSRKAQGKNTIGNIFSGLGGFFSSASQKANQVRQNNAIQNTQTSNNFSPSIGGLDIPTINAVQGTQGLSTPQKPQMVQGQFTPASQEQLSVLRQTSAPVRQNLPITPNTLPPTPQNLPIIRGEQGPIQQLGGDTQNTVSNIKSQLEAIQGGLQNIQQPQSGLSEVEQALLEALRVSPGEEKLQQQLGALQSSYETGFANIQDKPIALPFITGQQMALERRANVLQAPLQRQLALEQSKRQSALDVAQTQLDIEKSKKEEQKSEVKEVDGNLVRIRPDGTTETIYQRPTQAPKPVTVSPGASLVDPQTGEVLFSAPRQRSETEIQKAIEKTEKDAEARNTQISTVSLINSILSNPNLSTVSGFSRNLLSARLSTTADVRAQLAQLKALTALDGRSKLKGSGTISDFEAGMLADSANALNFAIQEDGRIDMSDDDVVQNLKNIKGILLTKAGEPVSFVATDPATGESKQFDNQTRKDAEDAALQGFLINYL